MAFVHLLLAALAATAVFADDKAPCACVEPKQTIDPITKPMIFFQQPTYGGIVNGETCSMSCDFIANLDAGADSNSTLQVQLLSNNLKTGTISVDGVSGGSGAINIGSNTPPQTFDAKSYGTSITIHFVEDDKNFGDFMIVVSKVKGRPDPPLIKTTTQAPPTAPYDPKFTHNPRLVANDIMITFDLSSPYLEKFKTFARDLIKELAVNPLPIPNEGDPVEPEDCGDGSRLTVVGLSSNSGFNTNYAPFWTTSYVQADGNINSLFQMGSGNYYFRPVEQYYAYGFSKNPSVDDPYTTCENRGKIFILFTSSSPNECDMTATKCGTPSKDVPVTNFLDKGIHQILVNYNMPSENMMYYNLYNATTEDKGWNYFTMTGGDKDVENFFNQFLVDSSDQMTCQLKSKTTQTEVEIGQDKPASAGATDPFPSVAVNIPPYYNAKGTKDADGTKGVWNTPRHYCNFQETTVKLIRDKAITGTAKIPMCLKVYYDLEPAKDYVSIIYNEQATGIQKEVVRLTGSDVSGTYFELPDAYGTIVFSSDEKNVYDGFHADITRGPCPDPDV